MATAAAEVHDDGVGCTSEEGCDEEEDVEKLVALSRAAARGDGAAGGVRDAELGARRRAVAQAVRVLHPRGGDARRFARRTRGERVVVGGGILGTADERQGVHRAPRRSSGASRTSSRAASTNRGRALARASARDAAGARSSRAAVCDQSARATEPRTSTVMRHKVNAPARSARNGRRHRFRQESDRRRGRRQIASTRGLSDETGRLLSQSSVEPPPRAMAVVERAATAAQWLFVINIFMLGFLMYGLFFLRSAGLATTPRRAS